MTIDEKFNRIISAKPTSIENAKYKINTKFTKMNLLEECYRELMVSYLPMMPLLEENVELQEADYILFMHCYARIRNMSDIVLSQLEYIDKYRKKGAKIIIVGKSTNIKDKIDGHINDVIYIPSHFTEELGKMFNIDMKEEYVVYDDSLDQLNIWPVDGCNCHCKFCRRSYMHIPFESQPIEKIKEKLDEIAKNHPEQLKHVSLRAENLTEYGIDIYGEQRLDEIIDLLNSYDEIGTIEIPIGMVISEINDKILAALCRCKKITHIDLSFEAGSNRLLEFIGKKHKVEDAIRICNILRMYLPHLSIGTTVMVGLPSEEISDIYSLADLLIATHPEDVLVNYYGAAEGQPLASLPQLSDNLKEQHLTVLQERLEVLCDKKMNVRYPRIYQNTEEDKKAQERIKLLQKYYDNGVYDSVVITYPRSA